MLISLALILPSILIMYFYWIRPILKSKPTLKEFYDAESGWLAAFSDRFAGIKQRLFGALLFMATTIVGLHDQIAPLLGAVDITPITSLLPPWLWTLIVIGFLALLDYFRKLADQRNAQVITDLATGTVGDVGKAG